LPSKAIPPNRDRLQSRAIVACGIPSLIYLCYEAIRYASLAGHSGHVYLAMTTAVSAFFALVTWRLKAATPLAAICGALVCFSITILSGRPDGASIFHSGVAPLIVLFALTHEATRIRHNRESDENAVEDRNGRKAGQVIANLGAAALASLYCFAAVNHIPRGSLGPLRVAAFQLPMLAALAEATADTVSSEIGQAFSGRAILLTTFRRVPSGTDGAISSIGTLAGIATAGLVALVGMPAVGINTEECRAVFFAAVAGLFFDSLLGATLERQGWIGNDLVNLASATFAAAFTFATYRCSFA
jgi:uncharacterized protein (TIGR00297 family)